MTRDEVLDYLREQAARPFVWGQTDCVQLCAGIIERVRGTRPELPAYDSEIAAARALVKLDGIEAAVSSFLGPMRRDRLNCLDGDIVLTSFQGEHGLGVAIPRVFWVRRTDGGMVPLDMTLARGFWPCRSS